MSNDQLALTQTKIHEQICHHLSQIEEWFWKKSQGLLFPVYSSFDIRDSSQKVVPVDANIFPAGFNNICHADQEHASKTMGSYLQEHYGSFSRIVLLTEEHTKNAFYWENIYVLVSLLVEAGYSVKVAFPRSMETIRVQSLSGKFLDIYGAERRGNGITVGGDSPELIICNNDFSNPHENWVKDLSCTMNPPYQLGWYQRKKSLFFEHYNALSKEFAHTLNLSPSLFQIKTEAFSYLKISDESSLDSLANKVDIFLEGLRSQNCNTDPFVFIKNNSGTYGLGIIQARSGDDIRNLNYKSKKKLKAVKGGGTISEVIIQEGVPSAIFSENQIAEPTIYTVGNKLVGGFLRTHSKKGPKENLNSPGAIYKKLCITDLQVDVMGCPMENVYGWVARLGSLAIAYEMKHYIQ